jgi:hypothetical protein
MTIYNTFTNHNHRTDLDKFDNDIISDVCDPSNNTIVHWGYSSQIITGTAVSHEQTIADFAVGFTENLHAGSFEHKLMPMKPDGVTVDKVFLPCYTNGSNNTGQRNIEDTKEVGIIFIDLDYGTNPVAIFTNLLSGYKFIAWTTISHKYNGNGTRLRIALFLTAPHDKTTFTDYGQAFLELINNSSIGDQYWLDKSCLVVSQPAIPPLYNQHVGTIDIWTNIGPGTTCFDLTSLTPIAAPTAPAKAAKASTAKTPKAQATGVATQAEDTPTSPLAATLAARAQTDTTYRADLLALVLGKKWIWYSTYSEGKNENGETDGSFSLCSLACAARECGMTIRDYEKIYKHAVARATEPMDKCWNAQDDRAGKSAWSFVALMTQAEREQFGLIEPAPAGVITLDDYLDEREAANTGYDIVLNKQYLTIDDVKHIAADIIAIHAPMGSGKTKLWKDIVYSDGIDYIMAVPTKIICAQQDDARIVTYDRAAFALKELLSKSDGTRKIYVVIDEIHNIYQTEYRPDANNNLYNLIKNVDGLPYTVVIQSGTADITMLQEIADINGGKSVTVKLEKDTPTSVEYQVVSKEYESEITINQMIARVIGCEGQSNILVIRQDGEENDKLALMLSDMGIGAISTNKAVVSDAAPGTPEYAFVHDVDFEMAHHNLSAIVSTSIAVEGVNIQDDIGDALVIVVGAIDPSYIVQASGRYRKAKNIKLIHIPIGASRNVNIDAYESKRRIEIKERANQYTTLLTGLAMAGKSLAQDVWLAYWRKMGLEAGKEEQALLKDGIIWTRAMTKPTICPEKAELYLMNDINRLKFYTSVKHQYAYMAANGFNISGRSIIGEIDIDECVIDALAKAGAAIAKRTTTKKDRKAAEMRDWLAENNIDSNMFSTEMQLHFDMPKNIVDAIYWADLDVGDKQAEYIDAYSEDLSYEEVRIRVTSDLRAIRKAIKSKYPIDSIIRSSEIAEIVESVMQWQADKCDKSGMDRGTMFERSSSIWCDRLDKIDYMACKITGSTNWCNKFLQKYDFIELVDTGEKKQEAGVRYKLYKVTDSVQPEIIVPIVESVVGNTDLRADMETRLAAMRALH